MITCCVIICYRPNLTQVLSLCASLVTDHAKVILVDNSEVTSLRGQQLPPNCELIPLGSNTGIARAQNIGIEAAIASGADIVAFFDQDSEVAKGSLIALVSTLRKGSPEVVSPLHFDNLSNQELPSVRVSKYGISKAVHRGRDKQPYSVDVVISSGMAATKEVFSIAGVLDESLFIDFVDTEWCLRCRSKKIPIRVVPSAIMRHRIGSRPINLGITTILVHNPVRCYYQLRNCLLLFRKKHIPFLFSAKQLISVLVSRTLLLFFVTDRWTYAKAYLSALHDGVRGVEGPKPL
jgi:rhamnosyltransferase